jgi:hypothetical protein
LSGLVATVYVIGRREEIDCDHAVVTTAEVAASTWLTIMGTVGGEGGPWKVMLEAAEYAPQVNELHAAILIA